MTTPAPIAVLHIDDSPSDLHIFDLALEECCARVFYRGVTDPVAALSELQRRADAHLALPAIVVVDINMPILRGPDVLSILGHHPVLQTVPVVVLSTTQRKAEVEACRALGAREVFCKPSQFNQMTEIAKAILAHAGG